MQAASTRSLLAAVTVAGLVLSQAARAADPVPTHAEVSYGPSERQVLDIYLPAKGDAPYPVLIWYGGIWKPAKHPARLDYFGKARVAVIAVQTRTMTDAVEDKVSPPISYVANDACRAVQFVRLNAAKYKLDPDRIARRRRLAGSAAGACTSPAPRIGPIRKRPIRWSGVSTKVTCVAAYRSQPSIDPKRMQEWVPGVEWGAPALGCQLCGVAEAAARNCCRSSTSGRRMRCCTRECRRSTSRTTGA